jgi:hypothetical protein
VQKTTKATRTWLGLALVSAVLLGGLILAQFAATTRSLYAACLAVGQDFDRNFRLRHPHDGLPVFPLHNRCNAAYDLVPEWVNPALTVLAVVMIISLIGLLFSRIKEPL